MKKILQIFIAIIIIITLAGCSKNEVKKEKGITKNIGTANIASVVDANGKVTSTVTPDDIVPSYSSLVDNLKNKDYTITNYSDVSDKKISTNRIYAENEGSFIDICYDLPKDTEQSVFDYYESIYPDYYILAINGDYVYCISDKEAFSTAGFTSLGNIGIQYICE